MMNLLHKKLHEETTKDNGYSDIVKDFDSFKQSYLNVPSDKVNYKTLLNFYRLHDFLEQYAEDNSFFSDEARLLQMSIDTLEPQWNDRKYKRTLSDEQERELEEDLTSSKEIYAVYQEVYREIREYYTQLQLILFSYNCGVYGLSMPKTDTAEQPKWKTDFSIGLAASFGKGATDRQYFLERGTEEMLFIRERENKSLISPGVVGFMNTYRNSDKKVTYGFNTGVGASIQSNAKINLGFFAGGSLLIGKQRKLIVNTGISLLAVKRVKSSQFQVGSSVPFGTVAGDVSERVFRPSPFLSLSYNLTKRKDGDSKQK